MKALLHCCQRSSAVQPHSLLPPTTATTDTPPGLLSKDADRVAIGSIPLQQQQGEVQRLASKAEGAASDVRGGAGAAGAGERAAAGASREEPAVVAGGITKGTSRGATDEAAGPPMEAAVVAAVVVSAAQAPAAQAPAAVGVAAGLPDGPSAAEKAAYRGASRSTTTNQAETGGCTASGAAIARATAATERTPEGKKEEGLAAAEGAKQQGDSEDAAAGAGGGVAPGTEEKKSTAAEGVASEGEGGRGAEAVGDCSKKEGGEAAIAAAAPSPAAGGVPGGAVQRGESEEGEGRGGKASTAEAGGDGGVDDAAAAGGGGGEGAAGREEGEGVGQDQGGGPHVRPRQGVSLEEMLEKKWQQLQHYLEEEQLFKAHQYLQLLEHQVEHRLAQVTETLHGSSPGGAGGGAAARGGGQKSVASPRPMSLQSLEKTTGRAGEAAGKAATAGGAGAGAALLAPSSSSSAGGGGGGGGKNRQGGGGGGEEHRATGVQQSRLAAQEQALCDFQKRLVSEQPLKNLRAQMMIFHQMLLEFHLDHLLQACEEPRLSCCESLVSTADESEQLLQPDYTEGNAPHGSGEGSRDGTLRVPSAGGGDGGSARGGDAVGAAATGAAAKGGRGGRAESLLLQHRASGGSTWSQSKGGAAATTAAPTKQRAEGEGASRGNAGIAGKDGSGALDSPAAAAAAGGAGGGGGGAAAERQEEPAAGGPPAPQLSERRLSSSKTFRQGLRSVVGRKMSFGKRSGNLSRRSAVKKAVIPRKRQDDEGWLRERGHCLDLAYRVEKDSSVSMKVRGKLPCMLFQVLAILNETDLAGSWAPFFKSAEKEYQYTKASQLVRQVYDYPLLGNKETLMFCVGVNALEEGGCVCIFCRSPPENATEFMGLPVPPPGGSCTNSSSDASSSKAGSRGSWVGGGSKIPRIQSADLVFLLFPISEGRQTTLELFGNFHHGLRFVPMRLITFVVKKIVRSMFVSIAKQCQHFQSGPYKERVERDPVFYGWMQRKIEEYVQQKHRQGSKQAFVGGGTDSAGSLASFNYEEFQD